MLGSFERAREWADLSNCLQRIKKTFVEHPELPVPLKKDLAKRLAQCLNPDLNVIHSLTLEVYNLVFERELVSAASELFPPLFPIFFLNALFLSEPCPSRRQLEGPLWGGSRPVLQWPVQLLPVRSI